MTATLARPLPTLEREAKAWAEARLLVGVDEVGRGPLAGPVVAAAVVFPPGTVPIEGVRDSKTLSPAQRSDLGPRLRAAACFVGVGAASTREIDRFNIRVATIVAMRRALARLPRGPYRILVDGLPLPELACEHEALIDGDALCYSVAAAGVVAKVLRDDLMQRLARRYPGYGWDTNAGYATAAHFAALNSLGATRHHRRTFEPVAQLPLFV
jgi:ribonuclease HII